MHFIVFFFQIECDSCNVPRCLIQESVIYEERMCAHNYVDAMYTGVGFADGMCKGVGLTQPLPCECGDCQWND